jgi:predicted RNA-binding Zn ribbon-like protein
LVAGEVERSRAGPAIQPGGRRPAPESLALVQEFINTHYDLEVVHGAEVLHSPTAAAQWLSSRGVVAARPRLRKADVARLLVVREGLRSLAEANSGNPADATALARLNAAAHGASVEIRFTTELPEFVAGRESGIAAAIGVLLARTAAAIIDGTWARLKICPGDDCGWAFYDHSRNGSGRWCSMSVCGGRAKARAHYRRQVGER